MIKILICCGGGFSSSALCKAIKDGIRDNKLENEFSIDFLPITIGIKKIADYDIMICCPHLQFNSKDIVKDTNNLSGDVPIYFLPPKMYGVVNFNELAIDIKDVIEMYKQTKTNPIRFPGEDNLMTIPRNISYRNYYKKDPLAK